MKFSERLLILRKASGLTQLSLARQADVAVLQIHRYEAGTSQPTLDAIRRLTIALSVSADTLVFGDQERGPSDDFRYQFETVSRMPEREQEIVREILDALILKNQLAGALERIAKPAPRSAIKAKNSPQDQREG